MMYSEFLSMTGKEENYISYKEYTESIETEFIWTASLIPNRSL